MTSQRFGATGHAVGKYYSMMGVNFNNNTYQDKKVSVSTSTLMKMAKTIQYIIHLVCSKKTVMIVMFNTVISSVCVCV